MTKVLRVFEAGYDRSFCMPVVFLETMNDAKVETRLEDAYYAVNTRFSQT